MNDRDEEIISAGLDDELESEDQERLAARLSEGGEFEARVRSFRRVDDRLQSLGLESISEERLAATFASLRVRLGLDASESSADGILHDEPDANDEQGRGRRRFFFAALAAAAALLLYWVFPTSEPSPEMPSLLAGVVDPELDDEASVMGVMSAIEEELVLALGYGNELSELDAISNEDLDVIERLDLLDFLSGRSRGERG